MEPKNSLTLVTGAAKSGKSEWAETLASQSKQPVIYIATAHFSQEDLEWQQRIEQHIKRRPPQWQALEVQIELAKVIQSADPQTCLLVDSLGSWLANLLEYDDLAWTEMLTELLTSLKITTANVIMVAEEAGWGVVPAYPLGRLFRDRLGSLVRQIGGIANPVYLVTGGHVLNLSILGTPLPLVKTDD